MKMQMKRVVLGALLGLGLLLGVNQAQAASTDTIQLRVTPSVVYSVQITSADVGTYYNFGTVGLNMTTLSERPAIVTNNGNVVSEWQVSAYNEDSWTLGTATGGTDASVLKALFEYRNGATPTSANYNTVNGSTLTSSAVAAENSDLSTNNAIVSNIPVSAQRDLYFMFHTPVYSSVGTEQKFRVYITAVAP